nr:pentatricopeptide repeat-containing protein At5g66631 [Ipomoea batatas]
MRTLNKFSFARGLVCDCGGYMFLGGFYKISGSLSHLTLQLRHFSGTKDVNKVALYLERARLIDSIRLSLRSDSAERLSSLLGSPALDSFVVTNALRSAPSPDSALFFIESLKAIPHFSHTTNTLYALAKILAKSGQTGKLRALINGINTGKFTNVARVSYMDRMRWYAAAGDLDEVYNVWDEWRGTLQKHPCTESYNIVIDLCAKKGKDSDAVRVFDRMINDGALPNSRTYTVIIDHLVKSGKFDSATEVFRILPQMRIKRTLKQYSIMVGAFISIDQLDAVKDLFDEMRADGILPGRAMQWSLQRMQEAGYDESVDELIREMLPDRRIKSIAYSMDANEDDEEEEEEENADCVSEDAGDQLQLKPWLDPAALTSALQHWEPEEVSALEDAKFVWTTRLVCKMIRNFNSAETAWQFFCWVAYQPGFTHDCYTMSKMTTKLARHGCVHLVDKLLSKMEREGFRLSFSTLRLIIDFYGISGNGDAALKVFHNVKTICGPISKSSQLILYSSLLRTLAKCKRNSDVITVLEEMILLGISPDRQTYSGLMHHFALQGDIKTVQRLFGMVRQGGLEPDAFMFKVLIHAYCKCEMASLALRIFEDMWSCGQLPDVTTKDLLVKSLWKEGKLREAAAVEERSEELNNALPLALPGHIFTMNSSDLRRVYEIYSNSFATMNTLDIYMDQV